MATAVGNSSITSRYERTTTFERGIRSGTAKVTESWNEDGADFQDTIDARPPKYIPKQVVCGVCGVQGVYLASQPVQSWEGFTSPLHPATSSLCAVGMMTLEGRLGGIDSLQLTVACSS